MAEGDRAPAPHGNAGTGARTLMQLRSVAPTTSVAPRLIDWSVLAARLQCDVLSRGAPNGGLERHAAELGVHLGALLSLEVGQVVDDASLRECVEYCLDPEAGRGPRWRRHAARFGLAVGVWTYPMRLDGDGVVGVRVRRPDGRKLAVTGSVQGVFVPATLETSGHLLVTEGPTDAAAAFTLGFDAVGRPCKTAGRRADQAALARSRGRDVVVIPDADDTGPHGARSFAAEALRVARTVRIVMPPRGVKDLRDWLRAGLTRPELLDVITRTPPVRPIIVEGGR